MAMTSHRFSLVLLVLALMAPVASAQWVQYVDETASRLSTGDPGLVHNDPEEKNYAWADFDRDGDTDLVIARKEPFLVAGKLRNILLINEGGVLTDRTEDFAVASDVPGDQGFLTPTNDRDVVVVDVDLDGWPDLVTTTTISPGEPKHVGHPRIYMNLGCTGDCGGTEDWLGFEYQDARIPEMLTWTGQPGFNPCSCDMAVGDVTGDDYPDLWRVDYDTGCSSGATDFQSRLLVNQGAENPGYFADETNDRFLGEVGGEPFPVNVDSLSGAIADMNNDGTNEVILESEGIIDLAYNPPDNEGFMGSYDTLDAFSTYFMNVADLNNDGLLDIITTDDGADRYYLNLGAQGSPIAKADFLSLPYAYGHSGDGGPASDDGFGDETIAVDLNRDGWRDVLTFDVDFEFVGCERRAHIYRNLGGQPGDTVILEEQTSGFGCPTFMGNPPSCLVASIPASLLKGTYDIAVFDIDGDSWDDLVIGRCAGTRVWINQPPGEPAGGIPNGADLPGSMLTLDKAGASLELSWGPSCALGDNDYAVYTGALEGTFSDHVEVTCSTAGSTSFSFEPATGDHYYLIVPTNGVYEGSYGEAGDGTPRQQGASACAPMNAAVCEP